MNAPSSAVYFRKWGGKNKWVSLILPKDYVKHLPDILGYLVFEVNITVDRLGNYRIIEFCWYHYLPTDAVSKILNLIRKRFPFVTITMQETHLLPTVIP